MTPSFWAVEAAASSSDESREPGTTRNSKGAGADTGGNGILSVPAQPKIYHIVHVDRLPSIVADGWLWCDAEVMRRAPDGTTIGMDGIKQRRLYELTLDSHPDLHVGSCVPFYFCPRSIMLYLIYRGNQEELSYRGGQGPIIHLEADLHASVEWATKVRKRWAFTLANAGARYFEDRSDLAQLDEID